MSRILCFTAVAMFAAVTANALVLCYGADGHQTVELTHDGDSHHECEDAPLQFIAGLHQAARGINPFSAAPFVGAFDVLIYAPVPIEPLALAFTTKPWPYHSHLHAIILLI